MTEHFEQNLISFDTPVNYTRNGSHNFYHYFPEIKDYAVLKFFN